MKKSGVYIVLKENIYGLISEKKAIEIMEKDVKCEFSKNDITEIKEFKNSYHIHCECYIDRLLYKKLFKGGGKHVL